MIPLTHKIRQMRREAAKDFAFFRAYYFPKYNFTEDASFHKELSHLLHGITASRGSKNAIAAPRESAKSTIVSLQYVLYCICYKTEDFILLVSSTADQAGNLLRDIKHGLETNERLIEDFPEVCECGTNPKPPRWTQKEIITRNEIKVTALSTGQQVRGRRNKEFRPSLIIFDDVESDANAHNPESYDKLDAWVTKSVLKAGSNRTNVVFVGTIHHYHSLLAKFTSERENPGWNKKIYSSVIKWSERLELWETWRKIFNNQEEFEGKTGKEAARKFFEARQEEMLEGTEVLWPQSKSYYDLMKLREEDGPVSFDSEMQNNPVNPRDCIFNLDELVYWDDAYKTEDELLRTIGEHRVLYGACDPSLGRQNRHGDYSAIISAVRDSKGIIYILDADIERRHPDKTISAILEHHRRRGYRKFGFETNQFQEYMASELEKRSREEKSYLALDKIDHRTDKRGRIEAIQPLVKNGTIRFSRRHYRLLEQMKYFPKGGYDDGLDALEMVVGLAKGNTTIFDIPPEAYDDLWKGFI